MTTLNERFADNGTHSHWEIIDDEGNVIASEEDRDEFERMRTAIKKALISLGQHQGDTVWHTDLCTLADYLEGVLAGDDPGQIARVEKGETEVERLKALCAARPKNGLWPETGVVEWVAKIDAAGRGEGI